MTDTPNTESKSPLDTLSVNAGTPAKPAIYNQAILDDMQKLYEQKQAEKNYWLQDLADASAWWSGGAAGPSAGLAQRAQTRAAQSKQLEDLQAQILQGKVNIAQLGEASGAAGQPSANVSGLPAGGALSTASPAGGYTIRGVPVPEGIYKTYQAYLKGGNLAKANEVFEKYNSEAAKGEISFNTNPAAYKQDEYYNESTGKISGKNPMEIRGTSTGAVPIPMARSALANNASTPPATPSSNVSNANPQPVTQTNNSDVYRFENLSDKAKENLNNYAKTKLGLNSDTMNRADASELFNKAPLEQRKNAFLQAGEKPIVSNVAQNTPMQMSDTSNAGATLPSYSEAKAISAGQKSYEEKAGAASGKAAGERQGVFEEAATDARKDLQNANVMLNIIDKHPESVGLSYKNRALGATIEGIKFFTGKDIEPLARRSSLSPEAIEAGNKFDALAETNNLKFRKAVMKGTGQVSDFETKLTERASGLSKDNSLEANRFFATIAAENYRTLDKLGTEWQNYQKSHPGAVFSQFEQSDTWKNAQTERENRLKTYFPEIERSNLAFGSRAPTVANPTEVEGWKKRYGKKDQ